MCQYIFSCSGFRENCTLHIGFQSIILYACHRQIGFYYHFSKHPCIRYEPHDTHIGRSSRFIHCLISDRGYFHYLVYRCSFQLKQTIFTTDGSTYKCRIRQRQQRPHWHMATDGYFHLQVSPSRFVPTLSSAATCSRQA